MVKNLETWVRPLGGEDPLEEGMVTHSSTLAWRIPWREESGRLESIGLQLDSFWTSLLAQLVKNPPAMKETLGSSTGEGIVYPLQYSCLENPMVREAWQATVHGVARVQHNLVTKPPPPP